MVSIHQRAVECRHVGYASCRQRVVEGAVVLVESYRIRIHSRMSAVGRIVGIENPAYPWQHWHHELAGRAGISVDTQHLSFCTAKGIYLVLTKTYT